MAPDQVYHDAMDIEVVVEIPKGTRNKYEADHETGHIWLDRMLFTATRYPEDYGYITGTLAGTATPWTPWCSWRSRRSRVATSVPGRSGCS